MSESVAIKHMETKIREIPGRDAEPSVQSENNSENSMEQEHQSDYSDGPIHESIADLNSSTEHSSRGINSEKSSKNNISSIIPNKNNNLNNNTKINSNNTNTPNTTQNNNINMSNTIKNNSNANITKKNTNNIHDNDDSDDEDNIHNSKKIKLYNDYISKSKRKEPFQQYPQGKEIIGELLDKFPFWEGEYNTVCDICQEGGELLLCEFCNIVFHPDCFVPPIINIPDGHWACPECSFEISKSGGNKIKSRKIINKNKKINDDDIDDEEEIEEDDDVDNYDDNNTNRNIRNRNNNKSSYNNTRNNNKHSPLISSTPNKYRDSLARVGKTQKKYKEYSDEEDEDESITEDDDDDDDSRSKRKRKRNTTRKTTKRVHQ